MKIHATSRDRIRTFNSNESFIAISTHGPTDCLIPLAMKALGENVEEWAEKDACLAALGQLFDDVETAEVFSGGQVSIPMRVGQAEELRDFVDRWKDEVNLIVCQCAGGISRSAGIASALALYLNGDPQDYTAEEKTEPNMHVFKLVCEVFGEAVA